MKKDSKILITGATGMVGKNLVKRLKDLGYKNLLTPPSSSTDLIDVESVYFLFERYKIDYVFHLAAKVGGIAANIESPADFLYDNLMISSNIINAAKKFKVKKLINLGSSCIYPTNCKQPMKESDLMSGKLEPTNECYALAKIVSLKLCQAYNKQNNTNFISLMPPNMYGPHDHFNSKKSHVISALLTKFHNAKVANKKSVTLWGTGTARREFLFVDDVVDALIFFMQNYDANEDVPVINVGTNEDVSIKELAELIKEIVGYEGKITWDKTKPDGMKKKLMDSTIANELEWCAKIRLREGLKKTYKWRYG